MADKTVSVDGIEYSTLNAALAGESVDLTHTGFDRLLTINCYARTDSTTAGTGTGYTTDANHYINIIVPLTDRHPGYPVTDGSKYQLSGAGSPMLYIREAFTRVTGLQIISSGNHGVVPDSTDVLIDKCLVKGTGRNGFNQTGGGAFTVTIRNTVVYECGWSGVSMNGGDMVYTLQNVTISECVRNGVTRGTGIGICTNVLCYHNGDGATYFDFLGTLTCNYCSSTDATADDNAGDGNVVNQTYTFLGLAPGAAPADNNFDLDPTDAGARNLGDGSTLKASYTDDIVGRSRPATDLDWDIGAFECPEGPTNYPRSVEGSLSAGAGTVVRKGTLKRNQVGAI